MRFIENPDLREWVKESLRRAVFQKAHELAVQTGCEVLVKLQDTADQSGQYYATRTLHLQYQGKGLSKQPWEVQVSGVTGLPKTVLVEKGCQSDGRVVLEDPVSREDGDEVIKRDGMAETSPGDKASNNPVNQSVSRIYSGDSDGAETNVEESMEGSFVDVKVEEDDLGQFAEHCSSVQSHNHDFGRDRMHVPPESHSPILGDCHPTDEFTSEDQGSNPVCDSKNDDCESVPCRILPASATYPIGFPINKLQALTKSVDARIHIPFPSQILADLEGTTQNAVEMQSAEAEAIIPAPKPYQCGICGKTFGSIQILSRHAQMNHGMDRRMCFLCDVCGQSYKLAQHLQRHMRMHRTVMPYICSVCNKGFFNGTSLIKHEKVHQQYSENTSFQCRICLKSFLRIVDLKEHVKQVHSGPGSAVSPQSSQNVFPSAITSGESRVEATSEGHLVEAKLEEVSQDSNFPSNVGSLPGPSMRPVFPQIIQNPTGSHSPSPTEEQCQDKDANPQTASTCSVVDSVSNTPTASAVSTHAGIRQSFQRNIGLFSGGNQLSNLYRFNRHVCHLCGKSYKYNFTLKEHLITHASVPQFVCKICGTAFTRQRQLRDHMFRHSGTYPYHCEFCGKGFIRPSTMKRHQTDRHRMLHEEL